jgi:hypothetical protein
MHRYLFCQQIALFVEELFMKTSCKFPRFIKGKIHARTGREGSEEEKNYSSTLSLISALDGGEWLKPRPRPLYPRGSDLVPTYRRLGGPQGRSVRLRKILPQPGFYPRTVQLVASRYTDYAAPAAYRRFIW